MTEPRASMTDTELVERTLAGDQRAAALLVHRHEHEVRRVFTRRQLSRPTVDDLTQETLLGCFRRLSSLAQRDRFRPWLLEIARHKLHDHYRATRRARAHFVAGDTICERPCERSYAAISTIEAEDRHRTLTHAMAQLPSRSRQLMQQYYWHELSRQQLAEQLGIPVGTVGSRLSYARKQLAEQLAGEDQRRR